MAAGRKSKGKVLASPALVRCLVGCRRAGQAVWHTVLRPSTHTFFLWSSIIFSVCGLLVLVSRAQTERFLCQVRPQSKYGGIGCERTPIVADVSLLNCFKPSCYINALNITYLTLAKEPTQRLYPQFIDASTDVLCNKFLENFAVTNPIIFLSLLKSFENTPQEASQACADYHCGVLITALFTDDLISPSGICPNTYMSKAKDEASTCVCSSLLSHAGFTNGELATVGSTGTSADMKAISDLCGAAVTFAMRDLCDLYTPKPIWCAAASAREPQGEPSSPNSAAERDGALVPSVADIVAGMRPEPDRLDEAGERRMQTVDNGALDDYTVRDWSPCTCYQQCTPGVRTRIVECLAATCRAPKPADRDACECGHVAQCRILTWMIVLYAIYFTQGGIAVLVFLFYLWTMNQTQDDFVKMGILRKIGGFFFKQLPGFLRLLVVVQLFLALMMIFDVFLSRVFKLSYQSACFESRSLRWVTAVVPTLWIVQVLLGRCARTYARKPDWLYVPDRPSHMFLLRHIRRFFTSLGP